MAAGYLAIDLMYLEHRARRLERRVERRDWRDIHDPFELHDDVFINFFRLSPDLAQELCDELAPALERQRPYGLSVEHQVLTALRFYAKGGDQDLVGEQYDLALSQPSVSRCVKAVTNCINDQLLRPWVRFPMTPEERYAAVHKFRNAEQPLEGTLGAMDCTYVHILGPSEHEEAYVNHWGDHSLNVQAICDSDLKILNINARFPGARHDAYIWANSAARRVMQRNYDNGERNTWLIADDGYPLEPWLMTPLKNERAGTPRFLYNDALCSARSVIERLFGVWKAEFRCLSFQRILRYDPTMAGKIVNACAVLHNMRIQNRIHDVHVDIEEVQAHVQANLRNAEMDRNNGNPIMGRALAQRIQAGFIARQFGRM